jgi:hypothetical protein
MRENADLHRSSVISATGVWIKSSHVSNRILNTALIEKGQQQNHRSPYEYNHTSILHNRDVVICCVCYIISLTIKEKYYYSK